MRATPFHLPGNEMPIPQYSTVAPDENPIMSVPAETLVQPAAPIQGPAEPASDRRADLDAKQAQAAALLREIGCEGLLLLEPENFAWLTAGGTPRGVLDPGEAPVVYYSAEQRWVISSNVDSQRLFDEEVDGLGFQLKEWPWHWGREQLLNDLGQGRKVACDRPLPGAVYAAEQVRALRRVLTDYQRACLLALGQIMAHALEATCRTMTTGESEREISAQISHRLLHRGVQPIQISVAADGRSRLYRQCGATSAPIQKYAVLTATGRKYGLHATASRSVCFGQPEPLFRQEHNTACKVSATYLASSWPDAVPSEILLAGRRVYLICGSEHEWMLAPQGHVTGYAPVELRITHSTGDLFQAGWAVTWNVSTGAASSCDTFVLSNEGPVLITPTETWPLKRIRVQGAEFVRPDLLIRQ
jgi:Xaa-Pro dipeptidase